MAYLGLDIGTTGCKASLINKNGDILFSTAKEYNLLFPGDGRIEISPDGIWESVCGVLSEITSESGQPVDCVSIASFGESFVLLDESDRPLADSIFYTDARGTEEIQDIVEAIPEEKLFRITGMPLNSMYSLNKLLWIQKHCPEQMKKARKLLLYGDYIGYRLTGERCIDYSLASRTMMLDIEKKIWSQEILDAFHLDGTILSTPAQAGTTIGPITDERCKRLGFQSKTPLILGGHDQACAALGAGAIHTGDSCDGFGAAECISVVVPKGCINEKMRRNNYCCEPHLVPDRYITLAFNTSAGSSLKWYRDTLEKERFMELSRQGQKIYPVLDGECKREPTSILFLPYLNGNGTPSMNATTSGGFVGITAGTTKDELYKAVMEGICLDMKYNIELLDSIGIPMRTLRAVGGGAHSDTLLQIKADVFGVPVKTLAASEAGTLGLAILSAVASGDYPDHASAIASMVKEKKLFQPIPCNQKSYEKKYRQFIKLNSAMKIFYE